MDVEDTTRPAPVPITTGRAGWVRLAAIMPITVGMFNLVQGLAVALDHDDFAVGFLWGLGVVLDD